MPRKKTGLEEGYVYLNYSKSEVDINPDDIPNLIPAAHLKEWQKDDPDPYYKTQVIEYPVLANGYNYQESFFKSFIAKLKDRPIPGSKAGHEMSWGARPETDFIMVGAKVKSNKDGTGKVYFKNYIPVKGNNGNNENFIRENKTDMIHYSLVTYPRTERFEDEEGNEIINVIESMKGERNDAVEYGLGAMKQTTNAEEENEDLDDLSNTASKTDLTDKKIKTGGIDKMTKDEILKLMNALKSDAVTLKEIAKELDAEDQLVTKEQVDALKTVNALSKLGLKNPIEDVKILQDKVKADTEAVLNAQLDKEFGPNPDAEKKENLLRVYAEQRIANIEGKDITEKIENIKKDPIALDYAERKTDYNSEENKLGIVDETKKTNINNDEDAIVIDKL